jgi:hypothetical protein
MAQYPTTAHIRFFDEEDKDDTLTIRVGEIFTGEDCCKILPMTAAVARMGTCFVTIRECGAYEFVGG